MISESKIQLVLGELDLHREKYFLPNDLYLPLNRRRVNVTYEEVVEALEVLCRRKVIREPSHTEKTGHLGPGSYRYFARNPETS